MGFDTTVVLYEPKRSRRSIVWEPQTVLDIGRFGTVIYNDKKLQARDPRVRARLLFIDCVFDPLTALFSAKGKALHAPPFHDERRKKQPKEHLNHKMIRGTPFPYHDLRKEHNSKHRPSGVDANGTDVVFARPLLWVKCEQMKEWLSRSEQPERHWRLRPGDIEAEIAFDLWKYEFIKRPLGMALFCFEVLHDHDESVI